MPAWLDRIFTPRPIPKKTGQKPPRATKVEGKPRPYAGTLDYEAKVEIPERPEVREALARVELPGAVLVEGEHPHVEGVSRGDASTGARRIESLSKRALASEKREHEREAKRAEREARKAKKRADREAKRAEKKPAVKGKKPSASGPSTLVAEYRKAVDEGLQFPEIPGAQVSWDDGLLVLKITDASLVDKSTLKKNGWNWRDSRGAWVTRSGYDQNAVSRLTKLKARLAKPALVAAHTEARAAVAEHEKSARELNEEAHERDQAIITSADNEKRVELRAIIALKDPKNALLSGDPSLDELRAEIKRLSTETTAAQRDAERRAYHATLADSHAGSAEAAFKRAHGALAGIEPGQPILVGHHSERHHRAAIARSDAAMRQGIESQKSAERHAFQARHGRGSGIRVADDDAVFALRAKLLEAEQKYRKIVEARDRLKKEGKKVDAFWATNASANVRRIKQRIEEAEKHANAMASTKAHEENLTELGEERVAAVAEDVTADAEQRAAVASNTMKTPRDVEEGDIPGVGVDYSDGRILLTFSGKPVEAIRTVLKSHAWKWSPSRGAWSRLDTPNARAVLRMIAGRIAQPEKVALADKPLASDTSEREIDEMAQQLVAGGYPHDAARRAAEQLSREGMGPFELEHRIKSGSHDSEFAAVAEQKRALAEAAKAEAAKAEEEHAAEVASWNKAVEHAKAAATPEVSPEPETAPVPVGVTNKPLYGHDSFATAYTVTDYPYGFKLRTEIRYWLEESPKLGWRFVSQTKNPKTGKWNAPKKSTYVELAGCMYLDEKGHVSWTGLGVLSDPSKVLEFVQRFPKADLSKIGPWALKKIKSYQQFASGEASWTTTVNGVRQPKSEDEKARERADAAREVEAWSAVARALGLTPPEPSKPKGFVEGAKERQEADKAAAVAKQAAAPRPAYVPPPLAPRQSHVWGIVVEDPQVSLLGEKTYHLDFAMPKGWEDEAEAQEINLRDWLADYLADGVRSITHNTETKLGLSTNRHGVEDLKIEIFERPAFIRFASPIRDVLIRATPVLDFIIETAQPGNKWELDEWEDHQRGENVEELAWVTPILDDDVTLAQLEEGVLHVKSRDAWLSFAPVRLEESMGVTHVREGRRPQLGLLARFYFESKSKKPTGAAEDEEIPKAKEFVGDVLCEAARVAHYQYEDDQEHNPTRSLDSASKRVADELVDYATSNAPSDIVPMKRNPNTGRYELSDANRVWCANVAHWAVLKVRGQIAHKHNEKLTTQHLGGASEARRLRALAHEPLRAWWKRVYVTPGLTPTHPPDNVLRDVLATFHSAPEHAVVRDLFDQADIAEHGVGKATHAEERAQWHAWLLATMREISAEKTPSEHRHEVESLVRRWTMDVIRKAPDEPLTNEQCNALYKEIRADGERMAQVRAGLLAADVPEDEHGDLLDTYIHRVAREHNESLARRVAEKKRLDEEQRRREDAREASERRALEDAKRRETDADAYAKLQKDAQEKERAEIAAVSTNGSGLDAKDEPIGTVMVHSHNGPIPRPFFFQDGPLVVNRAYLFSKRLAANSFNVTDMDSGYSLMSNIHSKEAAKEVARIVAKHLPEMVMSINTVKNHPKSVAFLRVPPIPVDPTDARYMHNIGSTFGLGMKQLGEQLQKPLPRGTKPSSYGPIVKFKATLDEMKPDVERLTPLYIVSTGTAPTPTIAAASQHAKEARKVKAALPTFKDARATLFTELQRNGWNVTRFRQGTSLPMKVPYATSPRGLRFDFHPQAIYTKGHSITSDYREPGTLAMLLSKGGTKQDPYSLHTPETLTPEAAAQGEKASSAIAAEAAPLGSAAAHDLAVEQEAAQKAREQLASVFRNVTQHRNKPVAQIDREDVLEAFMSEPRQVSDLQVLLRRAGVLPERRPGVMYEVKDELADKAATQKWIREQLVPMGEASNRVRAELSAYQAGVEKILNQHPTFNANALREAVWASPGYKAMYAALESARDLGWKSGANIHIYPSRKLDEIIQEHITLHPRVSPFAKPATPERTESQKAMADMAIARLEDALKASPNANAKLREDAEAHLAKLKSGVEAHDFRAYAKRLEESEAAYKHAQEITASDPHPGDFLMATRNGKMKWPYLVKSGPLVVNRTMNSDSLPSNEYSVSDTESGMQVLGPFKSRKKATDAAVWLNKHMAGLVISLHGHPALWRRLPMTGKNFLVGGHVLDSAGAISAAMGTARLALLHAGDVAAADKAISPYRLDLARAEKDLTTITPTH